MPIFIRVGLAALLSIAVVYFGPQFLGAMLAFLPDAVYEVLPMHPFILICFCPVCLPGFAWR